jgi:DNA helicase HerA-like ATPase
MFVDRDGPERSPEMQIVRDPAAEAARIIGHVTQCDGARATIIVTSAGNEAHENGHWSVGRFISISLPHSRIVGLVQDVRVENGWSQSGENRMFIQLELVGEVRDVPGRGPAFDRGISTYPFVGAVAHRIRHSDLTAVYQLDGGDAVSIGTLSQDHDVIAHISMSRTLSRHFAVVGSTGVGKSTAVSLLLHKAVEARPNLRVLILDPHNEFSSAFPKISNTIDIEGLDLPFWMFRLEELVEVLYRGRTAAAEEVELLRDIIPIAKGMNRGIASSSILRNADANGLTADTPVPYRMADILRILDDRMGLLESRDMRPVYRSLRQRLDAAIRDPRFRFMFGSRIVEDNITTAVGRLLRIPMNGKPVTCLQLGGVPSEVVNSVCSVVARLAFDVCALSKGKIELLLLCEEAHRYIPADPRLGFEPTRFALARIAKEGRKYGCYLGVVTQRPGELDPTIFSQCSTVFAMRLANERDQAIIRSAISDSSASTLTFLSSMGQREAITFGDGVATTMRMKFETLEPSLIPGSAFREDGVATVKVDIDLPAIVEKLRSGTREPGDEDVLLNRSVTIAPEVESLTQRPTMAKLIPDLEPVVRPVRRTDGRLFGASE